MRMAAASPGHAGGGCGIDNGRAIGGDTEGVHHLLDFHAEITEARNKLPEQNMSNELRLSSKPGVAVGSRPCHGCEGAEGRR